MADAARTVASGTTSRDLGKQGRGRGPVPRDAAGQINPAGVLFHNPRGRSLDVNPRADRFAGEAPVGQSRMRAREGPASREFVAARRHHGDPMLARRLRHGLAPAGEIRDLGVDLPPVRVPRQQDRMDVHVTFVVMAPQQVAVAGELPAHHGRDRGGEARPVGAGTGRTDDVEHIARLPAVEIPCHGLGERAFRLGAGVHRPPLLRREPVPPSAGHGAQLGLHALQRMAGGDEAEPHEGRAGVPQRGCKRLLDTAERFGIGAHPAPLPGEDDGHMSGLLSGPTRLNRKRKGPSRERLHEGLSEPLRRDRAGRHGDLEAPDIARQGALVEAFLPRGEHGLAGCSAQHQLPAFVAHGNVVSIPLPLPCFRLPLTGADVRHQSAHPARPAGPAHDLHDSGLGAERDGRSARPGPVAPG